MTFHEFATVCNNLEATSKRLELIDILSDLFSKADKKEIAPLIYLLQGRVAPFYAPIEIGMADKMVAQSIALTYEVDRENVLKDYDKKGDLGLVAEEFAKEKKVHDGTLSVLDVFDALTDISQTNGEGSVEKKISQLSELLKKCDASGAKHLVRIPLGTNRLGIGDPTVLDALAQSKLGEKTQRKLLEKAYNETSDLGLIGKTLFEHGLAAVQKLGVTVGRPIRSELCERLPNAEKVIEKMGRVHVTPKYDGFRVQIHKNGQDVHMYSRNLEDMTHMFPELIEGTLKQVKAKTAILDTEALAYNPESEEFLPFQETTKRRRKHNIEEVAKTLPLKAFVFDLLYADGKSLIDTPLEERNKIIKEVVHGDETLIPAPGKYIDNAKDLQVMLEDSLSKGLEGVVIKRPDSLYEAGGRNFNWVKLKRHSAGELHDTIDCVILGYIYGKGKRTSFGAGALLVGVYDKEKDEFVTVSRIGTGLSDEEWRTIHEKADKLKLSHRPPRVRSLIEPSVWVSPEIVIEVLADEITRSPLHTAGMKNDQPGLALRFPRLVSFRTADKRAEDATTVDELTEMYQQQGKKD